jgi:hypothetical protein
MEPIRTPAAAARACGPPLSSVARTSVAPRGGAIRCASYLIMKVSYLYSATCHQEYASLREALHRFENLLEIRISGMPPYGPRRKNHCVACSQGFDDRPVISHLCRLERCTRRIGYLRGVLRTRPRCYRRSRSWPFSDVRRASDDREKAPRACQAQSAIPPVKPFGGSLGSGWRGQFHDRYTCHVRRPPRYAVLTSSLSHSASDLPCTTSRPVSST